MRATDEALKRMDIARRVAQAYAKLDGIDSLAVGGSTARGNADEFSDVEIWMTYSLLPDEKVRKQILESLRRIGSSNAYDGIERRRETGRIVGNFWGTGWSITWNQR